MTGKTNAIILASAVVTFVALGGLLYRAFIYQAQDPSAPVPPTAQSRQLPKTAETGLKTGETEPAKPGNKAARAAPAGPAKRNGAEKPKQVAASTASKKPVETAKGAPPAVEPSFDIVRVEPSGDSVIAGRSQPGSDIELLNKGKPVATAKADPNGQFVIIPGMFKPGAHQLQLRAKNGGKTILSDQAVTVSVPEKGSKEVIVALTQPDKPTVILSDSSPKQPIDGTPARKAAEPTAVDGANGNPAARKVIAALPAPAVKPLPSQTASVRIRIVEAEQNGGFYVTGTSHPGARVRIYLNRSLVAEVQAGPKGDWSLRVSRGMSAGNYDVRADLIEPASGKVLARAAVPFSYPARVAAAGAAPRQPVASRPLQVKPAVNVPAPAKLEPSNREREAAKSDSGPAAAKTVTADTAPQTRASTGDTKKAVPAASGQTPATVAGVPATAGPVTDPVRGPGYAGRSGPADVAQAVASPPPTAPAMRPADRPPASASQVPSNKPSEQNADGTGLPVPGPTAHVVIERLQTTSVVKGDSLWRISRKILGSGIRYTQIYAANTDQVRNPDLIYPGQVLVVPNMKRDDSQAQPK